MSLFVKPQNVSYHESGHVVAAKLFDELLKNDFVTCDKEISARTLSTSSGGMSAQLNKAVIFSIRNKHTLSYSFCLFHFIQTIKFI